MLRHPLSILATWLKYMLCDRTVDQTVSQTHRTLCYEPNITPGPVTLAVQQMLMPPLGTPAFKNWQAPQNPLNSLKTVPRGQRRVIGTIVKRDAVGKYMVSQSDFINARAPKTSTADEDADAGDDESKLQDDVNETKQVAVRVELGHSMLGVFQVVTIMGLGVLGPAAALDVLDWVICCLSPAAAPD
eukprot:5417132-Amphidinium_carterae.1